MYRNFTGLVRKQHNVLQTVSEKSLVTRSGQVEIRILNPSVNPPEDSNDLSVVLMIQYKDIRIMIPGDISGYTERALMSKRLDLQSDVLFVLHHGAASSLTDEFLKVVHPRTAIISIGAGNIYGFPIVTPFYACFDLTHRFIKPISMMPSRCVQTVIPSGQNIICIDFYCLSTLYMLTTCP
ncbi:MAG: hypothetical protein ABSB79_00585 [Syntrophales bacterium]|jgi:beta-lactamase superfamily II metal-dependent hydrolase